MKVLHLDSNHPLLIEQFEQLGFLNDEDYNSTKEQIEAKIAAYDGIIIRSRLTIDQQFLEKASNLKFIGRVGAGLENIDTEYARKKGVFLAAAPEGNRNAVGEHALGLLLSLFNKLNKADAEIKKRQMGPGRQSRNRIGRQNCRNHWLWQYGKGLCQKIKRL